MLSSLCHYVTPDSMKRLPLTYKWTLSSIRFSFHFNLKLFSPLFAAVDVTNNGTSKTSGSQAGSKPNLFLQAYVKVKQYSNNKHCHTERINTVIINKTKRLFVEMLHYCVFEIHFVLFMIYIPVYNSLLETRRQMFEFRIRKCLYQKSRHKIWSKVNKCPKIHWTW